MNKKGYEICNERKDQFDNPIVRIKFKNDKRTALKKLQTVVKGVEHTISSDLGLLIYPLSEIQRRPKSVGKNSYYSSTSKIGINLNEISKNLWKLDVFFYGLELPCLNSALEWHIENDVIDTFYWWKRYH